MKKRIIRLLLAALLLLTIPLTILSVGVVLPEFYGETYYAVLPRMYSRLEEIQGPKIVVIGGSNVAFGLDGGLLEELLRGQGYDYTVCPFGLYAAVGTSAMLDLSRNVLKAGDIVVLAIEPTDETMSDYFGAGAFWKCAESAPELVLPLDKQRQAALFGSYISYLQERVNLVRSDNPPVARGVYAATSFDQRCDLIYDRPGNLMAGGVDRSVTVDFSALRISESFARQVRAYCDYAEKRGASVVLSFSPVNRACVSDPSEAAVEAFFRHCADAFSCPVISDPNRYILDSGWFYDSNFHLNNAGAQLRTQMLARDLLPMLGCYRDPGFVSPQMPPSAYRVESSETDSDCFLFLPDGQGTGLLISGLSETGKKRTELHVPASCDGLPVLGFADHALSDAPILEVLWIPESVSHLQAGLFQNAEKLTRLMLEHTAYPCGIEEGTIPPDRRITIHVPAASYPMYRDGYGCETNPWSAYLELINTY